MRGLLICAMAWAGGVSADPVDEIFSAAARAFDRMPGLQVVDQIAGHCGANAAVNQEVAYCTTRNIVFLTAAARAKPQAPYLVAHVLGHAVQVQHGVADVALREIRSRRSEEPVLRGYVASQVDCLAGFFFKQAGLSPASLTAWYTAEPFTGTHWGRDPLRVGPQVAITLQARDAWFQQGQSASDLSACAAGEFGAELLLEAVKD
ncbi:MAG: hypothetical protein AAFP98_03470 [Pseudomonadota bacterium]